jgi:long-chain acyl-CoA synthetase
MQPGTFCERLVRAATQRPDKVAMMLLGSNGADTTTFGSMLSQIRSLAYRLGVEGIAFGDRVAIIGENHPNWAIAYLGTMYRGAVVVPLDPSAPAEALANFLENSETKLTFVSQTNLEKFGAVCEQLGRHIRAVKLQPVNGSDGLPDLVEWSQTPRPLEFDVAPPPAGPDDMAVLMYTSGTTGVPKGVPLTHGNIYAEVDGVQEVLHLTDAEVILSLLPLFHAYSQIVNLWLATVIGARIVYISEVNSEEIARGLKEGGVTALTGVPRLWYLFHKKIFDAVRNKPRFLRWLFRSLLATNGWLRDSVGVNAGRLFFRRVHEGFGGRLRLAVSAGSSFDQSIARDYHALGFTILQGYGLTETAGAATVTRFEDNKVGSVGTPLNSVEVKIDNPNGEGIGEVLIRGPIVMPGYYRNPQANRESFTEDRWFRSGDLGRFDQQGHLYIVGRKKDVIILPSGQNVYPEDVEAQYALSPLVGEICVLGVRDSAGDFALAEKLCAVVVPDFEYLKAQKIANAREAIRFALDNLGRDLPEYQRVRDYIVRSEPLPRTAIRKVRRFELKKQIEELGVVARQARDTGQLPFTSTDRRLMETVAGCALSAAIRHHVPDTPVIHPQLNLELDLGLDSLARAECLASVEQSLGVDLDSAAVGSALTVAEVVTLANDTVSRAGHDKLSRASQQSGAEASRAVISKSPGNWSEILQPTPADDLELLPILKRKRFAALVAFLLLRPVYLFARVFLRMEVRGLEHVERLDRPFLICPNHQSYLDPLLVCSAYPPRILRHVFHVGASEYWSNVFTAQIARLINIVPVDTDTNLMRAMRTGASGLRAGRILNIYPEGERSFDGLLHQFKKGAAILASELDVPIVPVALDGVYKVWPRKSRRIRLAKVRIRFGEPINPREVASSDGEAVYERITTTLKVRIQTMLDEMRAS